MTFRLEIIKNIMVKHIYMLRQYDVGNYNIL